MQQFYVVVYGFRNYSRMKRQLTNSLISSVSAVINEGEIVSFTPTLKCDSQMGLKCTRRTKQNYSLFKI